MLGSDGLETLETGVSPDNFGGGTGFHATRFSIFPTRLECNLHMFPTRFECGFVLYDDFSYFLTPLVWEIQISLNTFGTHWNIFSTRFECSFHIFPTRFECIFHIFPTRSSVFFTGRETSFWRGAVVLWQDPCPGPPESEWKIKNKTRKHRIRARHWRFGYLVL